ncbi:helix-turn-helix domain-containing protein [Halobacteriaceae archaeon GCM10025711]
MSLFVEFGLETPVLRTAIERVPNTNVSIEQQTRTPDGHTNLTVYAEGGELPSFEAGLDDDETVADVTVLGSGDDGRLYQVELSEAGEAAATYDDWAEMNAVFLSSHRYRNGWRVQMYFHDREAFQRYASRCEDQDLGFSLCRISDLSDHWERQDYGLTELQTESLVRAFQAGHYSVPRETDLQELASSMDVSHQALSERLRRGVQSLIRNTLIEWDSDPTVESIANLDADEQFPSTPATGVVGGRHDW